VRLLFGIRALISAQLSYLTQSAQPIKSVPARTLAGGDSYACAPSTVIKMSEFVLVFERGPRSAK
jgi:hypothetical protein